jgi:hypothetical protein
MHTSKGDLPAQALADGYEARIAEWGEYMAYFERLTAGVDFSAAYETCECPHLGYVFRGTVRFIHRDGREETISAGEMYFVQGGHTFEVLEDAETVEFSPTEPYKAHMARIAANR